MVDLIAIAQAYRATMQPELQAKGVVVINTAGEACGWVNELRNPESWEPGCVAVDADGNRWLATGGNAYDGAEEWVAEQHTEEQAEVEAAAKSLGLELPKTTEELMDSIVQAERMAALNDLQVGYLYEQAFQQGHLDQLLEKGGISEMEAAAYRRYLTAVIDLKLPDDLSIDEYADAIRVLPERDLIQRFQFDYFKNHIKKEFGIDMDEMDLTEQTQISE